MLHLEKKHPSNAVTRSIAEVKSMPSWRSANDTASVRDHFDKLDKSALRECLLEEQHGLCAYCMKRISNDGQVTSIEHWKPLSKDKDTALDYNNLLAVCKGGADLSLDSNERRILCCDAHKSDTVDLTISPFDRNMMDHIAYDSNGVIKFLPKGDYSPDLCDRIYTDINFHLRLNGVVDNQGRFGIDTSTRLRKGRKDAFEAAKAKLKQFKKRGKLTVTYLDNEIHALLNAPIRNEYVGVTAFVYLTEKRKLTNMK